MLLIIPIKTDSPVRRRPYVNHALIAANILIYLVTDVFGSLGGNTFGEEIKRRFLLFPDDLALSQFFTYQFLHGGIEHLLGNMLFLWIFGNSVNSKMGNIAYLFFYLAAGVFAGLGFAMTSQSPCLGASGAIAGVTTAFLVLFPRSQVTTFYWIWFYIGTWRLRALLLIGLKIIMWDNILAPSFSAGEFEGVAVSAHIAGYIFGFVVCLPLLLIRALPRDQFDILALFKRFHQRQQSKAAFADPNARARATFGRVARPVSPETGSPSEEEPSVAETEIIRIRAEIAKSVVEGDYTGAAERYEQLLLRDPDQCLPRQNMLTIANQFMTMARYPQAAAAYEKHLKAYPKDSDILQIKFLLGIIYAKYLRQYEAAEQFLRESADCLTDRVQQEQAAQWLATVLAATGHQGPTTSEA